MCAESRGQFHTGRTYDRQQQIRWKVDSEFVYFTDDSRYISGKITHSGDMLSAGADLIERSILYSYDAGHYICCEWD